VNTQIRTEIKARQLEWMYIGFLVFIIILIPKSWERLEFLLMLFIPIILSLKYFDLDAVQVKKSLLFLFIFVAANYSTFLVHVWQLKWEIANPNSFYGWKLHIDHLLYSIPFNDGMWLRQFQNPILDKLFVTIYVHGFITCLLVLSIYFMLTGQPNKILHAMFAGHFLQYILILPFHFLVDGHQVWWIQNQLEGFQFLDPIRGHRTIVDPVVPSLNHVFPSMHTSIATVVILIAMREASNPIKYFFVTLNVAIIISTVYLGIHWVVDVIGGVLFGYLVFKLADKIMETTWLKNWMKQTTKHYVREETNTKNM
jgi:membrane-associated phospholipid phosphatase